MGKIDWLEWGPAAFERARAQGKPVLLNLAAHRPDVFSSAELEAMVAERFVPVALDYDERPDVVVRYGGRKGQITVLSASGARLDQTLAERPELAEDLRRFADAYEPDEDGAVVIDENSPVWTGAVLDQPPPAAPPPGWTLSVAEALASSAYPSFALNGRFDALESLLYAAAELGHAGCQARLTLELTRQCDALWDGAGGMAFFYDVKRLGPNARMAVLFWDAYAHIGAQALRQRALSATDLIAEKLLDRSLGALRNAQASGAPVYADANAMGALALMRASAVGGERRHAEMAESVLDFLMDRLFDPVLGMVHRLPETGRPTVYGLLADNAWTALALTESFLSRGDKKRREQADALLKHLFQELWERERGGFQDRAPRAEDFGLLKIPWIVPELNAVAFEAVWRLHHLKGNANYRKWLDWGIKGLMPHFQSGNGVLPEAAFLRLVDMLERGRTDLELVGRLSDARTQDLLAAATRGYLPRRIVSFVDPDDQDYIQAHQLQAPSYPRLFGCVDLKRAADAERPEEVPALLERLARASVQ